MKGKRSDLRVLPGSDLDPSTLAAGVDLSRPAGMDAIPVFSALDLVDRRALRAEGATWFYCKDQREEGNPDSWMSLGSQATVLGATLLRELQSGQLGPIAGARVVLRVQEPARVAMEVMTGAHGATFPMPGPVILLPRGCRWRLEVEAPAFAGSTAVAALHVVTASG